MYYIENNFSENKKKSHIIPKKFFIFKEINKSLKINQS